MSLTLMPQRADHSFRDLEFAASAITWRPLLALMPLISVFTSRSPVTAVFSSFGSTATGLPSFMTTRYSKSCSLPSLSLRFSDWARLISCALRNLPGLPSLSSLTNRAAFDQVGSFAAFAAALFALARYLASNFLFLIIAWMMPAKNAASVPGLIGI